MRIGFQNYVPHPAFGVIKLQGVDAFNALRQNRKGQHPVNPFNNQECFVDVVNLTSPYDCMDIPSRTIAVGLTEADMAEAAKVEGGINVFLANFDLEPPDRRRFGL